MPQIEINQSDSAPSQRPAGTMQSRSAPPPTFDPRCYIHFQGPQRPRVEPDSCPSLPFEAFFILCLVSLRCLLVCQIMFQTIKV